MSRRRVQGVRKTKLYRLVLLHCDLRRWSVDTAPARHCFSGDPLGPFRKGYLEIAAYRNLSFEPPAPATSSNNTSYLLECGLVLLLLLPATREVDRDEECGRGRRPCDP